MTLKLRVTSVLFFCTLLSFVHFSYGQEYLPNVIYVKLKPEYKNIFNARSTQTDSLNLLLDDLGVQGINPLHNPSISPRGYQYKSDIELIYRINLSHDALDAAKQLSNNELFEYAEASPIFNLLYVPNDSLASDTLSLIHISEPTRP